MPIQSAQDALEALKAIANIEFISAASLPEGGADRTESIKTYHEPAKHVVLPHAYRFHAAEPLSPIALGSLQFQQGAIDSIFSVKIKNVFWLGESIFITADGVCFKDLLGQAATHVDYSSSSLNVFQQIQESVSSVKYFSGSHAAVGWSNAAFNNHSHWLVQTLPRLHVFQEAGIDFDTYIAFDSIRQYQKEQIHTLDGKGREIQTRNTNEVCFFEELHVCYTPGSVYFNGAVYDDLIDAYEDKNASGPQRVYVSRQDAKHIRRLLNEDAVIEVMRRWHFDIVVPSQLSASDEVRIFRDARVVVGPLGAGLYNMVFTKPGACCVALSDPAYFMNWLPEICALRRHSYAFLAGISFESHESIYHGTHNNWIVDTRQLELTLRDLDANRMF